MRSEEFRVGIRIRYQSEYGYLPHLDGQIGTIVGIESREFMTAILIEWDDRSVAPRYFGIIGDRKDFVLLLNEDQHKRWQHAMKYL